MIGIPKPGRLHRGAAKAAPLRSTMAITRIMRRFRVALFLLPFASAGCYSYALIDPAEADPGLDVRARITPTESARLEELVGLRDRVIQGEVVDAGATSLILSIPSVLPAPGTESTRLHRRITLSNAAIVELEQRRLSRWRTFSLVGIAAAVAGYVVVSQFGDNGGDGGIDKPDPNNLVQPIRVPLR